VFHRHYDAPVEARLQLWLHLLAFATYTGATVAVAFGSIPAARRETEPGRRLGALAAALRVYDPLTIAALGVVVMTGAYRLTAYKAALRAGFFQQLGIPLAWKLFFSFLLIMVATYSAFGIGHRLVGMHARGETLEERILVGMETRLQWSMAIALVLVAIIVWIALSMPAVSPAAVPIACRGVAARSAGC
jgi:uncharacterized membrane protein